jgi:alpha-tubulin suppressor-like RCC1 family protein
MPNFSGVWNLKDQVQAIAAGRWTGIALDQLWAWGGNDFGTVGDGTVVSRSSPVQIGQEGNWLSTDMGWYHVLALKSNNTLWAWGRGQDGRLGLGDTVSRSSPTQIGALTNWTAASAGYSSSLALKSDGTLWAWGSGTGGKIGDGSTIDRLSPVQVGALTTWTQISSGAYNSFAIKTDGTLWAWGYNFGHLGTNNQVSRSSPVQIGALTNWSFVASGARTTSAIKTDNTLWIWGVNNFGQLGDGTVVNRSSPVQIGALTNWQQSSCGGQYTSDSFCVAVKTDGTLWAWGANNFGQLAQDNTTRRSSPVQVGALTTWASASAGATGGVGVAAAIKTDKTLWTWGRNSFGSLGDNTVVYRSSPVQVGNESKWANVSAGVIMSAVYNELTN